MYERMCLCVCVNTYVSVRMSCVPVRIVCMLIKRMYMYAYLHVCTYMCVYVYKCAKQCKEL